MTLYKIRFFIFDRYYLSASIFYIFTRNIVIKFISASYEAEHRIFLIVQLYHNRDIMQRRESIVHIRCENTDVHYVAGNRYLSCTKFILLETRKGERKKKIYTLILENFRKGAREEKWGRNGTRRKRRYHTRTR